MQLAFSSRLHISRKCLSGASLLAFLTCSLIGAIATPASAQNPTASTVADGAALVSVYHDDRFFEGPAWDPKTKKLYFTAFSSDNSQILRLDEPGKISVWLDKTEGVNGMYLGNDGRLLGAQAFGHRVVSYGIGPDGPADTIVLLEDKTLFQPNDIAQAPNGGLYFSDPDFKHKQRSAVYYLSPKGAVKKIIEDMQVPNGVIVSNDGKTLYVADDGPKNWRSYPISADGTVGPGRLFFDPPTDNQSDPDGMSIDEQGNLYLSGRGGVWVVDKFGKSLGLIAIPEFCSNVTFGGEEGRTLYLTCSKQLYSLQMKVRGAQFLPKKK